MHVVINVVHLSDNPILIGILGIPDVLSSSTWITVVIHTVLVNQTNEAW